jgi:hypothetical protein
MKVKNDEKMDYLKCQLPSINSAIIYIREGELCPNCKFAKLVLEPGNIIRCPICGFGNGAGCT